MTLRFGAVLAVLMVLIPVVASALHGFNRLKVYAVSKSEFEVVGEVGSGAANYWCGAGDHVRNYLRMPVVTRIYIWKAIGPSLSTRGRKAVQFSLSPPENVSTSPGYSLSVKAVGDNMTAAAAYQFCIDDIDDDSLLWRRW